MVKTAFCSLFSLLGWLYGSSQSTDLLRLEYTILPKNDSEIQTSRYRFLFNLPLKVAEDQYLVTGSEYNQIAFDNSGDLPFDGADLKKLHVIDLTLGYLFKLNENWRIVGLVTPRLASNIVQGVRSDDFKLNFTASLWKERAEAEKPYRLVLGLTYNSATGLPVPLPLISYYKRFHPNWSYALGIPRSNLRHHFNERHLLDTAVFLDGYFVNIQEDIVLDDGSIASSISLSTVIGAMEYQYKITKTLSFFGLAGYAFFQNGLLRDDKRNSVFILNKQGNIYFRTGIKVSIF